MRSFALPIGLFGLLLAGCSSYVTIPAQDGTVALHNPNLNNVVRVEAEAIRGVLDAEADTLPCQVQLPAGTSDLHHAQVLASLGPRAAVPEQAGPGQMPVIQVRQVRIRGLTAQVDLVQPASFHQPQGPAQLATVWLKWYPLTGWQFQHVQRWSIGLAEAVGPAGGNGPMGP